MGSEEINQRHSQDLPDEIELFSKPLYESTGIGPKLQQDWQNGELQTCQGFQSLEK